MNIALKIIVGVLLVILILLVTLYFLVKTPKKSSGKGGRGGRTPKKIRPTKLLLLVFGIIGVIILALFFTNKFLNKKTEQVVTVQPSEEVVVQNKPIQTPPAQPYNFCENWTEAPINGKIPLVDFPAKLAGDNRDWRFLIHTIGPVRLKTSNGFDVLNGKDVRIASYKGAKIFAYGNGKEIAQVKIKIL